MPKHFGFGDFGEYKMKTLYDPGKENAVFITHCLWGGEKFSVTRAIRHEKQKRREKCRAFVASPHTFGRMPQGNDPLLTPMKERLGREFQAKAAGIPVFGRSRF
jgi:hypothetical protein